MRPGKDLASHLSVISMLHTPRLESKPAAIARPMLANKSRYRVLAKRGHSTFRARPRRATPEQLVAAMARSVAGGCIATCLALEFGYQAHTARHQKCHEYLLSICGGENGIVAPSTDTSDFTLSRLPLCTIYELVVGAGAWVLPKVRLMKASIGKIVLLLMTVSRSGRACSTLTLVAQDAGTLQRRVRKRV